MAGLGRLREPMCPADLLPALSMSASADGVSLALAWSEGNHDQVECWTEPPHHAASDRILTNADALLRSHGLKPLSLQLAAVDIGPGPFTAVRAACSVAQGLSLAGDIRVVPVSSTEILAGQACEGLEAGRHTVLVVIDARMGEWYCASLEVAMSASGRNSEKSRLQSVRELRACVVCPSDEIWNLAGPGEAAMSGTRLSVAGNGAKTLFQPGSTLFEQATACGWSLRLAPGVTAPRADVLMAIALMRAEQSGIGETLELVPRYVRNKVALDIHEQEAARRASGRRS